MAHPLQTKVRILETARDLFLAQGYTKVTTDEIASSLGISKKTLYKHFLSKEAILQEVVDEIQQKLASELERILQDSNLSFVEKLKSLMTFFGENISRLYASRFPLDIQKTQPHVWQRIERFREEKISVKFTQLIEEGMRTGVLRKDINKQLVVMIYFYAVQNIINPQTLAAMPFSAAEAFESIIKVIFEGILTPESRHDFDQ